MTALASVCVATYNRRELLGKTLETLRAQTFRDFELIVCDDCSTDGTWEYLSSLRWPELKLLRNERNLNLSGSMTRLFGEARGRYIGMQHDHDLYDPAFLERMIALLEEHPAAGFGCCAYRVIERNGRVTQSPDLGEFRLFPPSGLLPGRELIRALATGAHTPIPAMGTVFRREAVERAGGYRPDWGIASDEDIYRRVAAVSDVAFLRERLFSVRARPEDRMPVFGGWEAIYTLYEYRRDTTEGYFRESPLFRAANKARLAARLWKTLLRESLVLWSRGEKGRFAEALHSGTARPGDRAPLPVSRALFGSWLGLLSRTAGIGKALGSARGKRTGREGRRGE